MSGPAAAINLVNLEDVRLAYGTRNLLDAVSLGIAAGDRIGVVGRNGGGKTTLLDVLARRRSPDGGRVTHTGGLEIGFLSQRDELDPEHTVRYALVGDAPDHAWRSDPRIRGLADVLLAGLDLDGLVQPLSGGERRRLALARLLVEDPDLLLLDEPTNHLDVESVDWLAGHLAARRGALVAVTHDRWFLDAVCLRTWEVEGGQVHAYDGGYAAYVLAKAERARVANATEDRRQNLLRKELAWLRRGPPARTSKPRFRIDAANALIADEPPARDSVELMRFAGARLGRTVYDVEDVTVTLGELDPALPSRGKTILDDVTWRLGPGDRVGIVGVNGAGKTTLLRLLAGELAPGSGVVRVGRTVKAAYLSQEVTELPPDLRALAAVEAVASVVEIGGGRELTALQLTERFGFSGERLFTRVGELSGGERRRLQLLRLLMDGPNVLLLDEPTNDLDVETLGALEDLLDGWPGTLVVVSHDRYFLERVCDRVVGLFGDGAIRDLPGGVEEYLARRATTPAALPAPALEPARASEPERAVDLRAARKDLARIERQLTKLATQAQQLHDQLAEHATDHQRVQALDATLREVEAQTAKLEDEWLSTATQVSG